MEEIRRSPDVLRRYFLGELSDDERERVEQAYLEDEGAFAEVLAAEEALLEDYVAGRVSDDDRRRLEQHLLASPRQRLAVQLSEALRSRGDRPAAGAAALPRRLGPPAHAGLRSWILAAALALIALAVLWAATRPTPAPPAVARQAPADAVAGRTTEPGPGPGKPGLDRNAPSEAVVSKVALLELAPGRERVVGATAELAVPQDATVVLLRLELTDASPDAYQARLSTAEGRSVWSWKSLTPELEQGHGRLAASLPPSALPPGDYVLVLQRATPKVAAVDLAEYFFRIVENN